MLLPILYLLLLLTATLYAQPARLVMITYNWAEGEKVSQPADTTWFRYRAGNTARGNSLDFESHVLKYDTLIEHARGKLNSKEVVTYNKQGHVESRITTGLWRDSIMTEEDKRFYTYDTDGNMLSELNLFKHWRAGEWDTMSFRQWTYEGQRIVTVADTVGKGFWGLGEFYLYTYDTLGRKTEYIKKQRIEYKWNDNSKETYTYNAAGDNDTLTHWLVNCIGNVIIGQYVRTYKDACIMKEDVFSSTDTTYVLNASERSEFLYDKAGRLITDSSCSFDDDGSECRFASYVRYTYNNDGYNDTTIHTTSRKDTFITIKAYNELGWFTMKIEPQFNGPIRVNYFYEPVPISPLPQSKDISIALPLTQVSDVLKVDVQTKTKQPYIITVHDAAGKQTGQWKGQDSTMHTIRATDWLPGSYTLTVSNGTDATAQYFTVHRGW